MLRLYLATVVMLGHYNVVEVSLATMAVCCFYIISGFYMQLLLSAPKVDVANFYISRALRIYPLYWILTAVTLLAQAPSELWRLTGYYFVKFLYLLNTLSLFGHDLLALVQYDPETAKFSPLLSLAAPKAGNWIGYNLTVLGQAWSLSVELLFYAMAPLLLKLKTRSLCLILFFSLCIKMYIVSFGVYDTFWIDAFYPAELMFFLSGALAFRAYRHMSRHEQRLKASARAVSGVALLLLAGALIGYGGNANLIAHHWFAIYFTVAGITVLLLPFLFHVSRSSPVDRWIGNLSYPVYLSHLAVAQIMNGRLHIDSTVSIAITTFAVSIALYTLIDKPVDKLRHAMFPIRQPVPAAMGTAAAQTDRLPKPVLALGEALHGVEMRAEKGWRLRSAKGQQEASSESAAPRGAKAR